MPLIGKVQAIDIILYSVETIDILYIRILNFRRIFSPVAAAGDKKLWPGSGKSREFDIAGFMFVAFVDGHSAFAVAAAKEVGRYHYRRH